MGAGWCVCVSCCFITMEQFKIEAAATNRGIFQILFLDWEGGVSPFQPRLVWDSQGRHANASGWRSVWCAENHHCRKNFLLIIFFTTINQINAHKTGSISFYLAYKTGSHSFLSSKSTIYVLSIFNIPCCHSTSWVQEYPPLFIHPLSNNLAPRLTFILHVSNIITF